MSSSEESCSSTVYTPGGASPADSVAMIALITVAGGGHRWNMYGSGLFGSGFSTSELLVDFLWSHALLPPPPPPSPPPNAALRLVGHSCANGYNAALNEAIYAFEGRTLDGRPFYRALGGGQSGQSGQSGESYLFYDVDCGTHASGWILGCRRPDTTATSHLQTEGGSWRLAAATTPTRKITGRRHRYLRLGGVTAAH